LIAQKLLRGGTPAAVAKLQFPASVKLTSGVLGSAKTATVRHAACISRFFKLAAVASTAIGNSTRRCVLRDPLSMLSVELS